MNTDWVWVLVPMTALSIPVIAVVGKVIVAPIVHALTRMSDAEQTAIAAHRSEQRFAEVDARLARMEQMLGRALAEQSSQRPQLPSGQETVQPPRLDSDTRAPVSRY
jgi:hypothetical protein